MHHVLGQYTFGYLSADQTKQEVKTADGVIRGQYSYVDANGLTQEVNYIADALGFRVAATNLPVHDVPQDVAVEAAPAPAMAAKVDSYAYLPYAQTYGYNQAQPVVAAAAPAVAVAPAAAPVVAQAAPVVAAVADATGSQYHAQDDFGQYSFGYNDPNSIRQEVKTADGIVRGAYKYVDTDGILQTVEYIADGGGFRVAATNLPTAQAAPVVDTPEVAAAKAAHYAALEESERNAQGVLVAAPVVQAAAPVVQAAAAPVVQAAAPVVQAYTPVVQAAAPVVQAAPVSQATSYVPATYATNYAYQTPVAPVVATADAANTQYHAQDDFGQFNYGYSNPLSTKQELKTADGVTRGSYSYVDANGIIQTVNYLSDALGFRVAATNLPVHHVDAAPAAPAAAPAMDTNVAYAYLPYATNYGYNVAAPAA